MQEKHSSIGWTTSPKSFVYQRSPPAFTAGPFNLELQLSCQSANPSLSRHLNLSDILAWQLSSSILATGLRAAESRRVMVASMAPSFSRSTVQRLVVGLLCIASLATANVQSLCSNENTGSDFAVGMVIDTPLMHASVMVANVDIMTSDEPLAVQRALPDHLPGYLCLRHCPVHQLLVLELCAREYCSSELLWGKMSGLPIRAVWRSAQWLLRLHTIERSIWNNWRRYEQLYKHHESDFDAGGCDDCTCRQC